MTVRRLPSVGVASPSAPASAEGPSSAPNATPAAPRPTAANSDAPRTGLTFRAAIGQLALERARAAVARGDASPAQAGMVASLGKVGFAGGNISRLREAHAAGESVETNPKAVVWAKENRVRSGDKVTEAVIPGEVRLTPEGVKVGLLHVSGQEPISTVQGHQPMADGTGVPTDAFVQSQTAQTLDAFLRKLGGFGLDLKSVYSDGAIRVFVNAMDILNAAYVPGKNIYFFGLHEKRFPLAQDKDTVVHEGSHGLLEHIVPGLVRGNGEGGAWHEAFGDLMAALYHRNPGIGEDLGTYLARLGEAPETLKDGIRRVDNRKVLDPEVTEVHDRSLAYSGLMWSTATKLATMVGEEEAADLMLGAIVKAMFYLTTTKPTSSDIVTALGQGLRSHLAKHAPAAADTIVKAMLEEAQQREMLNVDTTETVKPKSPANSAADVVKLLKSIPEIAKRPDVSFEVLGDRVFDNVRKVTVRPVVGDTTGKIRLPVEDERIVAVIEDGKILSMDVEKLSIPPQLNLERGLPEIAKGVAAAKAMIRRELQEAALAGSEAAIRVLEAFDELFSEENVKAEWVISRGQLCIAISTLAGDFVVDLVGKQVWGRSMLHMEMQRAH